MSRFKATCHLERDLIIGTSTGHYGNTSPQVMLKISGIGEEATVWMSEGETFALVDLLLEAIYEKRAELDAAHEAALYDGTSMIEPLVYPPITREP